MNNFLVLAIVFICLLLEQFFAISEIVMLSLNKVKTKHLSQQGSKKHIKLEKISNDPSKFLSTILIGTNLSVIISTVIITSFIVNIFGHRYGQVIAPLIISPFLLLFGEIIPKTYSHGNSQSIVEFIIHPLLFFSILFSPLIKVLVKLANMLMKALKLDKELHSLKLTREDLIMLIKTDLSCESLEIEEKKMIDRIFDFRDTTVKEVMTPLINVRFIEKNSSPDAVLDELKKSNFSRYPVFDKRVDNIIGILNVFDLFYASEGETTIDQFIRPAYYIPETKGVDDLLKEFRNKGIQMAVVVDEYGSNLGIATMEDILEEVVGEIQDEYDEEEQEYILLKNGTYIFDAQMEIDNINERFKLNLPKKDYETLAGLLLSVFEKIPVVGEKTQIGDFTFTIIKADNRKIKQVLVKKTKSP